MGKANLANVDRSRHREGGVTPEQMRRAAELLQAAGTCDECTDGMDGQLVVDDEGDTGFISDEHFSLARLLREQADATEVLHKLSIAQREVQAELQRMFSPPPPEGEK